MSSYREELAWVDTQRDVMLRRVTDWSNINSFTGNVAGLGRMADVLAEALGELGAPVERIAVRPAEEIDAAGRVVHSPLGDALRLVKRPNAPLRAFLCIHYDTVYPASHPFQITQRLDENTLRGPGVADAKGGLAIMLTALAALERSPHAASIGWEVLINPDEEIGSPGSEPLFAEAARRNHLGLLFEPALPGGALVDRRRGVGNFTIIVHGRSAHAGRDFANGRNAVVALAELIGRIHGLNEQLLGMTINVGRFEGGGATNVVPDLAIARVNARTAVPEDEPRLRDALERLIAETNASDGITVELHGRFSSPTKIPDGATDRLMRHIETCGADLNIPIAWGASGGASDGNKLAAAGLPNIDSFGPRGGKIHSSEEHIDIDSLTERAKLTALLLLKLASGDIAWPVT